MIELKEGDCVDYSHLLHRLCQTMGIPCDVVVANTVGMSGSSSSHVCNICKLDGHYYAVDLQLFVVSNGSDEALGYSIKLLD